VRRRVVALALLAVAACRPATVRPVSARALPARLEHLTATGSMGGVVPPDLEQRLLSAEPVASDDPRLAAWSYSPWLTGAFDADGGRWRFDVFLGGLGRVDAPNGTRAWFLLGEPR
jgi:hypothetical protein